MTVKELAKFTSRSERTVHHWIEKVKKTPKDNLMSRASPEIAKRIVNKCSCSGHGKSADFAIDEIELILNYSTLPPMVISAVMENAKQNSNSTVAVMPSGINPVDAMMAKVAETFSAIALAVQDNSRRITAIENQLMQRPGICLPAPQITPRKHISMIIREYVAKSGNTYPDVWNELYRQYSYRTGIDARKRAKNREMDVLDYIELEGQMEVLQAIAVEIFIEKKAEYGLGGLKIQKEGSEWK